MVDEENQTEVWVTPVEAVQKAINLLLLQKNHEHVPGYLGLLRAQKTREGDGSPISDIVDFYDRYLKVPDAPTERPYFRPFRSRGQTLWFNENVSGSYAVSNVKAEAGPFFRVAEVQGSGFATKFTLPKDHAARAAQFLLKGRKLPVAATAIFLYRDYGFDLETPNVASIVNLFRDEFSLGAASEAQKAAFDALFYDDVAEFSNTALQQLEN